jgi:hypothetical protein
MNRFEIIAERIGVYGKDIDTDSSWYYLKTAFRELEGAIRDVQFNYPLEEDYIKKTITDTLFYLLVLASKNDHCGACMCSDLEEKIRVLIDIQSKISVAPEIVVMQPTVINENNVPKIPPGVAVGLESDIQKISERAAGKYRYLISCDVFEQRGWGSYVSPTNRDKITYLSVFSLAVDPDLVLEGDLFFDQLIRDVITCTGVEWRAEKTAGFVAIKHDGRVDKINLNTDLVIAGENISRL